MLRYLVIACAALITSASALSGGTGPEDQLEGALAIIEHQEANLSRLSLEYAVEEEQADLKNLTSGNLQKRRWQHSLIMDGERRRLESHFATGTGSDTLQRDEVMTYDGKRYYTYLPGSSAGSIGANGRMNMCFPDYVYGSEEGLLSRLKKAQKNIQVETVEKEGRSLLKVTAMEGAAEVVFLLDPDAAYQPCRITRSADVPAHVVDATGATKTKTDILITGYLRKDGFCLPQEVEYEYGQTMKDGKDVRVLHRKLTLTKAALNPPVAPDAFQIQFPSDTWITLADIGVTFKTKVPENGDVLASRLGDMATIPRVAEAPGVATTRATPWEQGEHSGGSTTQDAPPRVAQPYMAQQGTWGRSLWIMVIAGICIGVVIVIGLRRAKSGRSGGKPPGGVS